MKGASTRVVPSWSRGPAGEGVVGGAPLRIVLQTACAYGPEPGGTAERGGKVVQEASGSASAHVWPTSRGVVLLDRAALFSSEPCMASDEMAWELWRGSRPSSLAFLPQSQLDSMHRRPAAPPARPPPPGMVPGFTREWSPDRTRQVLSASLRGGPEAEVVPGLRGLANRQAEAAGSRGHRLGERPGLLGV